MVFNPFYSVPFDYVDNQQLGTGETVVPRFNIGSSAALVSQTMVLTFWTAIKTEFVTQMSLTTSNTAAGATPTYCAYGVYQVSDFSASPTLSILGQTANDTTMFASTFSEYLRSFTNGGFWKYQGQRYATAVLIVSGAAMPNFFGYNGTLIRASSAPRLTAAVPTQSVIPATVIPANLSGSSQMHGFIVSP
jgi:hypothetical protein